MVNTFNTTLYTRIFDALPLIYQVELRRVRALPHTHAKMDHLASNNPAVSVPASQALDSDGQRQRKTLSNSSEEQAKASVNAIMPPSKLDVGWRRVVRNFSPSWFSVTMVSPLSLLGMF